ncbi:MAG: GGDEF domain-containing protein [Cereibacter sphaeroides]|uniref:diguanylate cyclase n=1 Tax=Cereibacter sphaeroides TaxID=1063 RepID=A0A2W5RVE7_CERSP|nr:MAG: GGDEF domain-containing protein [Cereibacter sphaeroides]
MDLRTLWYLTLATLLVGATMTLWERRAAPLRARELGYWAAGFFTLAAGCFVGLTRAYFPVGVGAALTNLVMLLGYLLVLQGVVSVDNRYSLTWTVATLATAALAWLGGGVPTTDMFWHYVSSFPIAMISGLTAIMLRQSSSFRGLRSKNLAVAVFAFHGAFYLSRATLMPLAVAAFGKELLPYFAATTMLEGSLYAVAMPMALIALVREEYQVSLLEKARTDHLTGLANRRGFFDRGETVLKNARIASRPVALLAFDLDHFKDVNDRYGHAVGDRVLKAFAEAASGVVGRGAILARIGGEEFTLLLAGENLDRAQAMGEQIASLFAAKAGAIEVLKVAPTVSIGLAEAKGSTFELNALLDAADRALYRAKSLGRNRIEVAGPTGMAAAA